MPLLFLLLLVLATGCSKSEQLHVYCWSEYFNPEVIEKFEETYHCNVIVDTFDSNESMFAKLSLGGPSYDLVVPSNYFLDLMDAHGMLQPIDKSLLPNLQHLDPQYERFFDPRFSAYGIPYSVTYAGIAYRQDKVPHIAHSWGIFSHTELRGRMTMLNDLREVFGAALKYHGYSANTVNKDEIAQATETLLQWKKNLTRFEGEQYRNGIASAEYFVVQGQSGDIFQVMRENASVAFFVPKEGSMVSGDYFVVPKGAKNVSLAHAFINFFYEPEHAAKNMAFNGYICPNRAAYALLPEHLKRNRVLFPPAEWMENSELIRYVGPATQLYNEAWDRVKSSTR